VVVTKPALPLIHAGLQPTTQKKVDRGFITPPWRLMALGTNLPRDFGDFRIGSETAQTSTHRAEGLGQGQRQVDSIENFRGENEKLTFVGKYSLGSPGQGGTRPRPAAEPPGLPDYVIRRPEHHCEPNLDLNQSNSYTALAITLTQTVPKLMHCRGRWKARAPPRLHGHPNMGHGCRPAPRVLLTNIPPRTLERPGT